MLPDRSVLIGQKLVENAKIEKNQMRHFGLFSNTVVLNFHFFIVLNSRRVNPSGNGLYKVRPEILSCP